MIFHSNYPHTDLFIHKSSIAEVNLIIPSYVLNFALCSTNMEGGKSWQNISAEEQERLDAQCPTHTSNVPPWAWHAFPGKKKALFQCAQVPSRAIETILYLWPVWDRRTRAGASPGSQSNTQLEQHKWVLGLEEFNFIIRYPNLAQCSKYTISIDSLSSSPSIQKAVKRLHGQKKKKKKIFCTSSRYTKRKKKSCKTLKTLVGVLSLLDTPQSPLAQESTALRLFTSGKVVPYGPPSDPWTVRTGKWGQHRSS